MGIKGKTWIEENNNKSLKLEALKILFEIKKEMYSIGTIRKEDYDRSLCEISMEIKNMGIL